MVDLSLSFFFFQVRNWALFFIVRSHERTSEWASSFLCFCCLPGVKVCFRASDRALLLCRVKEVHTLIVVCWLKVWKAIQITLNPVLLRLLKDVDMFWCSVYLLVLKFSRRKKTEEQNESNHGRQRRRNSYLTHKCPSISGTKNRIRHAMARSVVMQACVL